MMKMLAAGVGMRTLRRGMYGGANAATGGMETATSGAGAGVVGSAAKKVSINTIRGKYANKIPLTVITAYDFPTASLVSDSGADMLLVGDSLAMVVLGHDNTKSVTMNEMIHHCKAASRGGKRPFLIGDMPFGSYEPSTELAVTNAIRFLSEGGMDAVKLEGGRRMSERVKAIVRAGIPVMGHIGLTPQTASSLGGYVSQGRTSKQAVDLLHDALELQNAGCFAVVLEMVPNRVASAITQALTIPTIGIGAGSGTSGQVLVFHDMLGLYSSFVPKFCKQYAQLAPPMRTALTEYVDDVVNRRFPSENHSFPIKDNELHDFLLAVSRSHPHLSASLSSPSPSVL